MNKALGMSALEFLIHWTKWFLVFMGVMGAIRKEPILVVLMSLGVAACEFLLVLQPKSGAGCH